METSKNFLKKNIVIVKISVIAILTLLMLIPISMVKSLITERDEYKTTVKNEINEKWGGAQSLVGPILVLPYKIKGAEANNSSTINYAYFLPEEYNIKGELKPENRSRGVYEILGYQSIMNVSGKFSFPNYEKLNLDAEQIQWKDAFLLIGIPALQGIKNKINLDVNGESLGVISNVSGDHMIKSGITAFMPLDPTNMAEAYDFKFDLTLNGSDGLYFAPIGKQTDINIESKYNKVAFVGDFLPNNHDINKSGFNANWKIFDYNRNYSEMWIGHNHNLYNSQVGVKLLLPIDEYQKTMRSAKYAIMFIALTFLVFFMVELLSKKRIHPVQYLLVSIALILFYTLLLALSEHIGFDWSYLVSALAIVGLITAYSYTIFKSKKQTLFMGVFLSALYVFLYVVIQLEDMALLFGSIGLFIALATVMYVSRKVDWYKEDGRIEKRLD